MKHMMNYPTMTFSRPRSEHPGNCQLIETALDRFQEAHYWIHGMEKHYHQADPFRWHLNAFLKAMKETPKILSMDVQHHRDIFERYKTAKDKLMADPLIRLLSKKRDVVVHQKALSLQSTAQIGLSDSKDLRFWVRGSSNPYEDSDTLIRRYLWFAKDHGDAFGLLIEDEDLIPCVRREWCLPDVDGELVDACTKAWITLGRTVSQVLEWLDHSSENFSLENCPYDKQAVRTQLYSRSALRHELEYLRTTGRFRD